MGHRHACAGEIVTTTIITNTETGHIFPLPCQRRKVDVTLFHAMPCGGGIRSGDERKSERIYMRTTGTHGVMQQCSAAHVRCRHEQRQAGEGSYAGRKKSPASLLFLPSSRKCMAEAACTHMAARGGSGNEYTDLKIGRQTGRERQNML